MFQFAQKYEQRSVLRNLAEVQMTVDSALCQYKMLKWRALRERCMWYGLHWAASLLQSCIFAWSSLVVWPNCSNAQNPLLLKQNQAWNPKWFFLSANQKFEYDTSDQTIFKSKKCFEHCSHLIGNVAGQHLLEYVFSSFQIGPWPKRLRESSPGAPP